MNERIKELVKQATTEEHDGFFYFDKKKFAELIALECAELMEQQHTWITSVAASKAIRVHFGVE